MLRFLFFGLCLFSLGLQAEINPLVDGVEPGRFTMDFEAAQKYAKDKKQAVLLNFTGSDWCHWCTLMEKNVFAKEKWMDYAKDNVLMVWLDFPQDPKRLPQKYIDRNLALKKKFHVKGFPTYILLGSDGKEISRLEAGQSKTPVSFAREVEAALEMTEVRIEAFSKKLGTEKGDEYKKLHAELQQLKKEKTAAEKKVAMTSKRIAEIQKSLEVTRVKSRLDETQQVEYEKAREVFCQAQKEMKKFIDSRPQSTVENRAKYQKLYEALYNAKQKLDSY